MPKSNQVASGTSNQLIAPKPQLQVVFKPPLTGSQYHYFCPDCGRKYYTKVGTNGTCKYCLSNPKLVANRRRKKDKQGKDEINMDLGIFSKPSRKSATKSYEYKPPVFEDEDEDEVAEELANLDEDLDDFDFEPPARDFDIAMRLTSGPERWEDGERNLKNVIVSITKTSSATIGARAGRPQTTAQAMGFAIKGKGTLSASKVSHRSTSYKPGGKTHDEWCHLVGDALGGGTDSANLVAGSYGCNTYMAAVEMLLIGQTHLQVEAEAFCSADHVAEFIRYKIASVLNPNKSYEFYLDAANNHFTKEDLKDVQEELSKWLKTV